MIWAAGPRGGAQLLPEGLAQGEEPGHHLGPEGTMKAFPFEPRESRGPSGNH